MSEQRCLAVEQQCQCELHRLLQPSSMGGTTSVLLLPDAPTCTAEWHKQCDILLTISGMSSCIRLLPGVLAVDIQALQVTCKHIVVFAVIKACKRR